MPTNDLLPFGTGAGANVLSQSDYSGLVARQTGFQAGTAVSTQLNKVWRQSTFVAAMIGEFIKDNQTLDVVDDGNVAALEAKFAAALQSFLGPNIVHVGLNDTGTANAIVASVTPALSAYSPPCVVVFRKRSGTPNTDACTVNFGAGIVAIKDNTGANFGSGALLGGSFHVAVYDGAQFIVLGGSATYTSVTNLTANSGDAVEVTTGGIVNFRTLRGTADSTPNSADRWPRGEAVGDQTKYMTTSELITYLNSALTPTIPPNGPGAQVGQFVDQSIQVRNLGNPTYAGFSLGMTVTGGQLQAASWPGVDTSKLYAWMGVNGSNFGTWAGVSNSACAVDGTLAGTWRLTSWSFAYVDGYFYGPLIVLRWVRIA